MRRIFLAFPILFIAWSVCAQSLLGFPPGTFTGRAALDAGSAPSYTGPGDLGFGAATAWFGLRCYTAAYAGSVADITDSATGSTTGTRLKCDGAGNVVATVSLSACTFVTGNACSSIATTCAVACNVLTLYDQTAASNCTAAVCDMTQATNARRPIYLNSSASCGTNSGLSCIQCSASPCFLASANLLSSTAQTFYTSHTFNYANAGAIQTIFTIGGTITLHQHNAAATKVTAGSSTLMTSQTATDSAWHSQQTNFAGASSIITLDGTAFSGLSGGVIAASGNFRVMAQSAASAQTTGFLSEAGIWPSTSTFNATTMYNNQHTYYGF